jgi:hypothetical protein
MCTISRSANPPTHNYFYATYSYKRFIVRLQSFTRSPLFRPCNVRSFIDAPLNITPRFTSQIRYSENPATMVPTPTNSIVTILLVIVIILLATSLGLFLILRMMKQNSQRRQAEAYRGKGALLPIANIHAVSYAQRQHLPMMESTSFNLDDSFRAAFYKPKHSSLSENLIVPEIRITFPDEDLPPPTPGKPGQRTSRVVVVQVGESGAAYVTAPPPYEGFQDVDMSQVGGLREKH